ncbi:bifunctional folylpolyglutamate synthase/dihydrofolate synthase [Acetobacter oeni]|uniref:tetrahydrofolate synthase n=1 Tax=Acetobacter oeni TaxID=304077 RepID=A0A511XLN3_9PROT|nr:folylpolyglutamate synthase/dihydrofolate synthase family protein [Acetobacter oeni]MBB3884298.1 dihydrofolate synthase/folylpolyglutamate synthase [Acetobacter oeni]NHO20254.1 bifunctional folylpolyglutamate synthase/dihydrofolate synthase [Acetobacter oeni]GBR07670.1 bifunctional protein FolC [Acetobacter oeni LMG 21952]GEN63853.1 bifunctional folylpolyglutamate synthase/dihydrofolate synthase [Acetobacter oeni]
MTIPAPKLSAEFTGRTGTVLERLNKLYPALIDLSLGRLETLLARLGHPERKLPPVIHVAGTNGKGSTCANLRAIGEAAGWRVHVMSSPHLVDVTERFRIAGQLVSEDELIATLEDIERVNNGAPITVFEVLTAAGFVLFARHPAELAIIEVGLGGRFDATNVIPAPAACAISIISMDHEAFLGSTLKAIASEKAGIIKPGVPVVTGRQDPIVMQELEEKAARKGAPLFRRDRDWTAEHIDQPAPGLIFTDPAGTLRLPPPALTGPHQDDNAALAIAALRASGLTVPEIAWPGIAHTTWAARLQRLHGTLAARLPADWELWLDGGHNPGAGEALAPVLDAWSDRPLHIIIGMKQTKDATGFLSPLLTRATTIYAVAEPDQHLAQPVEAIVAAGQGKVLPGPTLDAVLDTLPVTGGQPARVLICGSLYLAGVVLKKDGWQAS